MAQKRAPLAGRPAAIRPVRWQGQRQVFNAAPRVLIAGALIFTLPADLPAQEPGHPCSAIASDPERLACYDRAFGKSPQPPDGAASARDFGASDPDSAAKKVNSITAIITKVERRRDGLFVVTLDNGQVWSQAELDSRAEVRAGDSVSVRRGALGSYLLSTSAGIGTRVKRLR
jgi:hypothetical protein